jgi:hypothetical protein
MVASTTETSFKKISLNQKNFHVLSFIYRLKLKQFENLNGIKNSFKLKKLNISAELKNKRKKYLLALY